MWVFRGFSDSIRQTVVLFTVRMIWLICIFVVFPVVCINILVSLSLSLCFALYLITWHLSLFSIELIFYSMFSSDHDDWTISQRRNSMAANRLTTNQFCIRLKLCVHNRKILEFKTWKRITSFDTLDIFSHSFSNPQIQFRQCGRIRNWFWFAY